MYKIITKGIATNGIVNWSFYKELGQEYVTSSIESAVNKYRTLLNSYSINNLKLVDEIGLDINVQTALPVNVAVPLTAVIATYNDEAFSLTFEKDDERYTWVDYNTDIFSTLETELTELGLTNITISVEDGIKATNEKKNPIVFTNNIPEGLFIAYDKVDKTINNVSAEYDKDAIKTVTEGTSSEPTTPEVTE